MMGYKNADYGHVTNPGFELPICVVCGKEIDPPRGPGKRYTHCVWCCNAHTRGRRGRNYMKRRMAEVESLRASP